MRTVVYPLHEGYEWQDINAHPYYTVATVERHGAFVQLLLDGVSTDMTLQPGRLTDICMLPEAYRPRYTHTSVITAGGTYYFRVIVTSDGHVRMYSQSGIPATPGLVVMEYPLD